MIPAVPNQVWIILIQTPPLLTASDESGPGEPQVPPPGHQASQLEPRPGQRGGQGRGEAAQKRWDPDSDNDNEMMIMTSASCVNLEASHLSRLSVSSPRLVIPVTPESGWGSVMHVGLTLSLCCDIQMSSNSGGGCLITRNVSQH